MRTFELRQYTLRSEEAVDIYVNQVYPRHLGSFPSFDIEPHGIWIAEESSEPQVLVLVSYPKAKIPVTSFVVTSRVPTSKGWD